MRRRPRPLKSTYSAVQRPTPRQFEEALSDHCIALSRDRLQFQVPSTDRSGEVEERANLLTAEPDRSIILRSQLHDVVRGGERKANVGSRPESRTADRREPVEQLEADLQRQLLARERIDDGFEHRRKPGQLHAQESIGEQPQPLITRGHPVPLIQINPKPEKPLNDEPHMSPLRQCPRRRRCHHDHSWRRRCGRLAHREFRRPSPNDDDTSICRAIPPVHQIARPAPQCPDREIEAERRNWPQLELERGRPVTRHGDSPR